MKFQARGATLIAMDAQLLLVVTIFVLAAFAVRR